MNTFLTPTIIKDSSSLEKKLQFLNNNKNSNEKEINMLEMGIKGEKEVLYYLTKSNIGMYILRDINIECDDLKAQIDFIVITNHHCYFIESKNYNTDIIHIDGNGNFEISTKYNNKYIKKGIKSPVSQVNEQLEVFKRICLKNQEKTKELLSNNKFKKYFKTLVVFTNPDCRINSKKAPYDLKYKVLKVDNLIRQIKLDEKNNLENTMNVMQMKEIAKYFMEINKEITIEKIEQPETYDFINNTNNKEYKYHANLNINKTVIKIITLGFFILFLITYVLNSYANNINTDYSEYIAEDTINSINNLREKYKYSKENGFDLYNYDQCLKLKKAISNNFSCLGRPMEVNFNNNHSITIYKNNTCYYLDYDPNSKKIIKKEAKYVGYDNKCPGTEIGLIYYDDNNKYLNQIGGYKKILEMATFAHNNSTGFDNYYDYTKIEERGGNPTLAITYKTIVDSYFATISNKGGYSDNNLEDFNKMIEYYYYIHK